MFAIDKELNENNKHIIEVNNKWNHTDLAYLIGVILFSIFKK